MFSSLRGFFERHRRKIVITGALLGGAYALGKLAHWKLSDWYETQQVEFLAQSKKQLHFDGNQKTCNTTFYSLLPGLQDAIFELVDSEAITEKLKNKPSDKLLLWEQLKILSFTRTVTAIYASSLLAVFLRVQLNLLGGYMYLDVEGVADESTSATPEESRRVYMSDPTQKKYLGIVRYFLEAGVKDLVGVVQNVVEGVLGSVSLKQKLSYHDIKRMLGQIRQCLKFSSPEQSIEVSTTSQLKISSIVLPKDSLSETDVIFSQLLNETADILESEDFQVVFNACLDVGFMFVMKQIKSSFIVDQQDTPPDMICSIEDGLCSIHLPLAKICPIINGKATEVFSEDKNDYLHDVVSLECVKSFAANIYEAFSSKPRE